NVLRRTRVLPPVRAVLCGRRRARRDRRADQPPRRARVSVSRSRTGAGRAGNPVGLSQGRGRPGRAPALVQRPGAQLHDHHSRARRSRRPGLPLELADPRQRLPRSTVVRTRRARQVAAVRRAQGAQRHHRACQGRRRRGGLLGAHPGRAPVEANFTTRTPSAPSLTPERDSGFGTREASDGFWVLRRVRFTSPESAMLGVLVVEYFLHASKIFTAKAGRWARALSLGRWHVTCCLCRTHAETVLPPAATG